MSCQTKVGLKHLAGKINLNTQQLLGRNLISYKQMDRLFLIYLIIC